MGIFSVNNTNASWIGKVPSDWKVHNIGSLYTLRNEKVSDIDYPPLSVTMKGIVPQLDTAAKTDNHDARKLVRKGDFAINSRSDRRGSCGISKYDGSVSLINTVLTPRGEMNPEYYNWLFHTVQFADEFYKNGHGIVDDLWTTNWDEMKRIMIPVPNQDTQTRIALYLNDTVSHIETIIVEAKASIDEYKKWKSSIIHEAVTKGLNNSAKMVDSGVDWIGSLPENWGARRLKLLVEHMTDKSDNNDGYIGLENVESASGRFVPSSKDNFEAEGVSTKVKTGNVIFGKLRPYLAKCAIVEKDGCCSSEFIVMNTVGCEAKFLKYVMLSPKFIDSINMSTYGAKMPRANWDFIGNMVIPLPPREEQLAICGFIEKKSEIIDALIDEKESLIVDLEAYKKSLIFEAVTGKRKVV